MRRASSGLSGELFQGAVYGLGISIAVWIPLNSGVFEDAGLVLACLLAALAGLSRGRREGVPLAALPWVAAAHALAGPGAALLVAAPSVALGSLASPSGRRGSRIAFRVGSVALATVAGSALASLPGTTGLRSTAIFCAAFALASGLLFRLDRRLRGHGDRGRGDLAVLAALLVGCWVAAWGIVYGWHAEALRPWLGTVVVLRCGWWASEWRAGWKRRRRRRVEVIPAGPMYRRLAEAIGGVAPHGGRARRHLRRVEALSRAMGQRLGVTPKEAEDLSQASLLHHAELLAVDDPTLDLHPALRETTLARLGFPEEVREILTHLQERWDGRGPRGLDGERIVRAARILAVADRYDRITHENGTARPHAATMARLRRHEGTRFDPLMLELLDELREELDSCGGDLGRREGRPARVAAAPGSELRRADRALRTLYGIERAARLPILARERWTLAAGLLRGELPFDTAVLEAEHVRFVYGSRTPDAHRTCLRLDGPDGEIGRLSLTYAAEAPAGDPAWTARVARAFATIAADAARDAREERWTDPATGLPNGAYLRRVLEARLPGANQVVPGVGLIAIQLREAATDAELGAIARRLAERCEARETLVRFGSRQFLVVVRESRGGELVARWHALLAALGPDVAAEAAHAAHPADGRNLDELLGVLDERLAAARRTRVLPFRAGSASA